MKRQTCFPSLGWLVLLVLACSVRTFGSSTGDHKTETANAGQPVGGLGASAKVTRHEPSKERKVRDNNECYEVVFQITNTTDKPIRICTYPIHQPLKLHWIGPDGKVQDTTWLYRWAKRVTLAPYSEKYFPAIPARGTLTLSSLGWGSSSRFMFCQKATGFGVPTRPGHHRMTISYTNKDDGSKLKLKGVWTGTITAKEVSFRLGGK